MKMNYTKQPTTNSDKGAQDIRCDAPQQNSENQAMNLEPKLNPVPPEKIALIIIEFVFLLFLTLIIFGYGVMTIIGFSTVLITATALAWPLPAQVDSSFTFIQKFWCASAEAFKYLLLLLVFLLLVGFGLCFIAFKG